jgi:hypothetical protein
VGASIAGLDVEQALENAAGERVRALYEGDRREARTPHPVAGALRRTANTDGAERHTAPTLIFTAADGRQAIVPGFQPYEAHDVALMNLEPRLARLPAPDLRALLEAYPGGLTSQEVARVLADTTAPVDRASTEAALTGLVAARRARRTALADDALWTALP